MTENSERCCTCTTPEITIKLNKQGPQGLTGPQGEPGFSPVVEVSEETPTSYRLSIQTLDGSYETPNLKANFPLGGYVNQVLVKQSNADGDATWDYIPYATTETTGGLTLATEDDVVVGSTKAITGDILAKVVANFNDTLTGYVDLTSAQTIRGAKTFNNNLTVTNGHTVDTDWLNVRNEYISMGGKSVVAREQNAPVSGLNYNEYFRIGGNLPLLLSAQNDVVRIKRDGSAHIIVDADNIGDYIPSNVVTIDSDKVIQTPGIKLPTRTYLGTSLWSSAGNDIIFVNGAHIELGNIIDRLSMVSRNEITIFRGTNGQNYDTYTNLDSGNISSDPYIQSLVSRIEALES